MDFQRFKRDIWTPNMGIDELIAWTSIRSFIKGSIEAVAARQPLSEDAYVALGKKRCRLSEEQRRAVFNVFDKYQRFCSNGKLWDDCDRISNLCLLCFSLSSSPQHITVRCNTVESIAMKCKTIRTSKSLCSSACLDQTDSFWQVIQPSRWLRE
jgi:hypothetical protein